MSARPVLRIGMGEPYAISAVVASSSDFNPALPTAATFEITKPDTTTKITRAASITAQSASSISITYPLVSSDLDQPGTWRVWVQWTVAGQTPGPRTEVTAFQVIASDQLAGG